MAATTGISGLLAASTSNSTADLINTIKPYSATLNVAADELDATAFASGLVFSTFLSGWYGWTISGNGRFPTTPQASWNCAITQSGSELYLSNVTGFSLDFAVAAGETTALADTAKTYAVAGPIQGRFTINARVDGTTALILPNISAAAPGDDISFTIGAEGSNDDLVFVDGTNGGCRILSVSPAIVVGSTNDVTITGVFSGAIEIDGDSAIFGVSTPGTEENMPLSSADTVTLTAAPSRTYSGSAFWTQIGITAAVGSPIDVSFTLQGSGALTVA